jgi:nucleotide-binding universal stress UspA family protein
MHIAPRLALPSSEVAAFDAAWERSYETTAHQMLDSLAHDLDAPADVHVERVLKRGDPARELLVFAEAEDIDLIATGSHGHGPIARAFVGSVSTRIVRGAHCAVLVVPAAAAAPTT